MAHRHCSLDLASFFLCAIETRWLGVRKNCGVGLFYRNYRSLVEEIGWLVSDFISVCLETCWLVQNPWFLCPGMLLYISHLVLVYVLLSKMIYIINSRSVCLSVCLSVYLSVSCSRSRSLSVSLPDTQTQTKTQAQAQAQPQAQTQTQSHLSLKQAWHAALRLHLRINIQSDALCKRMHV